MFIMPLEKENTHFVRQAARLLAECFPHAYRDSSEEEINHCLEDDRIALIAVEEEEVLGFIGAIPQYDVTGWELHPLAVRTGRQSQGIGTKLIHALEEECRSRGGITIYLGSDDEFGKTTLSHNDLYSDTYEKMASVQNVNRHPYEFYQKVGYKIVGVIPDANGIGKPDIWMAKRIVTVADLGKPWS